MNARMTEAVENFIMRCVGSDIISRFFSGKTVLQDLLERTGVGAFNVRK